MAQISQPVVTSELKGSDPIPEAVYNFRITRVKYVDITNPSYKGAGKNNYIEVEFTVTGPAENERYIGRKCWMNMSLAGEGAYRTKDLFEKVGIEEFNDTDQLINCEVAGVTVTRPGNPPKYPDPKTEIGKFQALI
jgi:hypothetical protein